MVQTEKEAFWYLNLTTEQTVAYDAFRKHLKEKGLFLEGHDDQWTLLRFLKARQWDVSRATTMYTDMANWRRKEDIEPLFDSFVFPEYEMLMRHYPHFYHKTDSFGRPLYIELLGISDVTKMLEATTIDRLTRYHIWSWERTKKQLFTGCAMACGKPILTSTVIIDLQGLSLKNFTLTAQKVVKTIAHVDQDYYPEHLGQMFIINAPIIFRAVWAIVNPLLEERTRRKISILGYDYYSTLVQAVPAENLPVMFGGKSFLKDYHTSEGPWVATTPHQSAATVPVNVKAVIAAAPEERLTKADSAELVH